MSNSKKTSKGFTFQKMCLTMGVMPMLIAVLCVSILALFMLSKNIKAGSQQAVYIAASNLKQYFEFDLAEADEVDYDLYADHVYIESQQENSVELTLFRRNERFLSSLKTNDGNYAEGTYMSDEVWAKIQAGETYFAPKFDIYGVSYFAYYVPVYDSHGNVWGAAFAGSPTATYETTVARVTQNLIFVTIVLIILCTFAVLGDAKRMSKTVKALEEGIIGLSDGNLEADFTVKSRIVEFRHLADCGANLKDKLNDIIGNAKDTAKQLDDTATHVDALSASSAEGTSQIAEAVTELTTTAQSMAETVQDANASIIEMGDIIDIISDNVNTMVANSKENSEANNKAVAAMDTLGKASEKSAESIDSIRSQIGETNKAIDDIRTAADTISAISSETNLLALNASIEAARAGDAGRGFAVVAENIKKLAEESNQSAGQIQDIINHIIAVSEKSVQMADEVGVIVEQQKEALEVALKQMNESKDANLKLGAGVDTVGLQAEALTNIKESVLANISDLSAVSEENAASSEEVNASVDTIAQAVEETREESAALKEVAGILIDKMSYFK